LSRMLHDMGQDVREAAELFERGPSAGNAII